MKTRLYLLLGLLWAGPAIAAAGGAGEPLGVVLIAEHARMGGVDATSGTNLYSGEELVTGVGGDLQVRVGGARVELGALSAARFLTEDQPVHLELDRGSLQFSSPATQTMAIETPAGTIRGAEGQAVSGMIVLQDTHVLLISAYSQDLVLDNFGELHLIRAGRSYRIAIQDPDEGAPPIQARKRRRKLAFYLIGGAGAAFAAADVWVQGSESPYKP